MNAPETATLAFVQAAERVLSGTFGGPVRLGEAESLRDKYRNRVVRCPVADGPAGAPASVIVKASVGEGDHAYDPTKDGREDTAWRFFNEWAGTRFLNEQRAADPPLLCAKLLGADRAAGLIVLEDLGTGSSLADALQGDDPVAATTALRQYAASMGRLHAQTIGGEDHWRRLRQEVSGHDLGAREGDDWREKSAARFREHAVALGVPVVPGFDHEADAVQRALTQPGPFDAFAPGDTCPDNHRLTPGGPYLRFFDFEFAGFRHALLDAAYLHLPFPTCWCVARLPGGLPDELEAAYRKELVKGCPEAAEDAFFHQAMSHARAYWTLATVAWGLEGALKENSDWGLSTNRQRHPLRLENFAARSDRFGHLPALSQTCRALAVRLRALWPEGDTAMPPYPPFDGGAPRPAPVSFG